MYNHSILRVFDISRWQKKGGYMDFANFFKKCRSEPTVSDFESYLAYCIFEKTEQSGAAAQPACTLEAYSRARDLAFEGRDEDAARWLYDLARAAGWQEGEWEGALR
jgi:hypothetical protein